MKKKKPMLTLYSQDALDHERRAGYADGLADGQRKIGEREREARCKAIDAMAHALKAMADVLEPKRV